LSSAITQNFITPKDLSDSVMITWFGHSMFLLEDDREKLLFDPFHADMVGYGRREVEADVVMVSHGHGDHNNVDMVRGRPAIINKPGAYQQDNYDITGRQTYHDENGGSQRGLNIVFNVTMKGITFEHLGDLGHVPEGELADELSNPDVLFVPVGGVFTIDADTAAEVVRKLNPRVAIPMHYGTPAGKIPLGTEEPFINHFQNVERISEGPIYMNKEQLPEPILVLVMSYVT
jgi:L-ascorbate metabolism protein UlaG (beta-lactamase superfamily)